MTTATAVVPALPLANFGGRYVAQANADGTFAFLNIPIVGELAKGTRPDYPELAIDREWLEEAHASLAAGAKDEYLPPLNVNHHGQEKPVEHIGFIRARDVRKIRFRGAEMYALFADLERVPAEWAVRIAQGRLPYCSIEGPVKGPGDVKSLAMLTDKPPQFGFPIITAGSVIGEGDAPNSEPWSLAASTYRIFSFAYEGDEGKPPAEDDSAEDAKGTHEEPDGDEDEKGKEPEAKGGGEMGELLMLVRKLFAVLCPPETAAADSKDATTGTRGPVGAEKSDVPAPKDEREDEARMSAHEETTMNADPKSEAKLAALENDLAALKAKEAARDAEATAASLAAAAEKTLTDEGFHLAASTKARIAKFAKMGKEQLDEFVGAFKETATKDPPRTLDAALSAGQRVAPLTGDDESLVAKFAGNDASAGEIGRKALRAYPAYAASTHRPMSKERWVEMSIATHNKGDFNLVSQTAFENDE